MSRNHLLLLKQGHIFQQQTHHAFAIPIRVWKIVHQVGNRLLFERSKSALFCGIESQPKTRMSQIYAGVDNIKRFTSEEGKA